MVYYGIPTYKRAEEQLTLEYLEKVGVKKEQIIMSVQTEEDNELYRQEGYDKRVGLFLFSLAHNRSGNTNTILERLPRNAKVVLLDDDIKCVNKLDGGVLSPINTEEGFREFIEKGYRIANSLKTIGFSVYPCNNAYFMSDSYHTTHIGEGTLLAITNTGIRYDTKYDTKEDYEVTCRIIKTYGCFPRLNMHSCDARHRTRGGCKENWDNKGRVIMDSNRLLRTYPDLVRENKRRRGEVLMRRIGERIDIAPFGRRR